MPEQDVANAGLRYRRQFEAALDGILILEAESARIVAANAAAGRLLGREAAALEGRKLWQIGLFGEESDGHGFWAEIRSKGSLILENLSLPAKDEGRTAIELTANAYRENGIAVVQCNLRDITERALAARKLVRLAWVDSLTRLPNRMNFERRLIEAFSSARRGGRGFAVHYLDLDHFKDINDTLGHQRGDLLLMQVAERVRQRMRETDTVARFGGDEFAVLQTNIRDAADAGALATKITASLAAPFLIEGNEVRISASIGIALYSDKIARPDTIVSQADLALYRSKEQGRNRYGFHTLALDQEVGDRVSLGRELQCAIDRGELELHYQPQVDLASGRLERFEALVRWPHPARGWIPPSLFIPVAERTGAIVQIGHYVIDQACRQLKAWRDAGLAHPVIAINLSAAQFKLTQDAAYDIAACSAAHNLQAKSFEIELTEPVLRQATREHADALERFRALGVRLAIDDFGTGLSSLDELSTLPISRLKIAQSFMHDAPGDSGHAAIVHATIGVARAFGLDVVAEGIETEAQVRFLIESGCATGQGHYFSRAVDAAQATRLLRQGSVVPETAES